MDTGFPDRVETKLDNIAAVMGEVREQVRLTNGRVTKLEIWQGGHEVWTQAKHAQMQADEQSIQGLRISVNEIQMKLSEARGMARAWVAVAALASGMISAFGAVVLQHYIK